METEFIHQTLKAYETPYIASTIKLIYDTLEHGRCKSETDSTTSMIDMLQKVKILISNARNATGAQFLCFKEDESVKAKASVLDNPVQTNEQ